MLKKETLLKHAIILSTYILLIWGFYRFLFKLPDELEEFIIKPLLWLIPVFYLLKLEKLPLSSVGITLKNLFPSVYLALGLGAFFVMEAAIANFVKHGGLNFNANIGEKVLLFSLIISFATAFSEETVFRGYIFTRLWRIWKNEWLANLVSAILFMLVHLPVGIFVLGYTPLVMVIYLFFVLVFAVGSAFVFARTGNITSSILLHVFWSWPIILFK